MPNRAAKARKRDKRNKNLAIKKFKRDKKRRKKDGTNKKLSTGLVR